MHSIHIVFHENSSAAHSPCSEAHPAQTLFLPSAVRDLVHAEDDAPDRAASDCGFNCRYAVCKVVDADGIQDAFITLQTAAVEDEEAFMIAEQHFRRLQKEP